MVKTIRQSTRLVAAVAVGLAANLLAYADVAPDPGYVRQSANLILETDADLSDFRFFLESPMKVEEIKITGRRTVIDASGRAGAMRFGKLIAIPKHEYDQFVERLTEDELKRAFAEKKLFSSMQLLSHNFQTTIPDGEQSRWQDPVYRIERDGQTGLKAIHVSGGANAGTSTASPGRLFWGSVAAAVVAGIFLLFGLTITGIWYFRRSSKQP